jgi:hypothetical protein
MSSRRSLPFRFFDESLTHFSSLPFVLHAPPIWQHKILSCYPLRELVAHWISQKKKLTIVINFKVWAHWSVTSPLELTLMSPSHSRSSHVSSTPWRLFKNLVWDEIIFPSFQMVREISFVGPEFFTHTAPFCSSSGSVTLSADFTEDISMDSSFF